MNDSYTVEKNVQMLIYLMKKHNIKKVIASPGTTNITFLASIQQDTFFEIYSAADERSAAYIACGMAAESGEPVALTCTGATASRNYISGLTEAYYRKLPILAITSSQHLGRIGQLIPQVIDRSSIQNDIAVLSVNISTIHDEEDEWDCNVKLNSALLALRYRGGGPVHINLCTTYNRNFNVEKLPEFRTISRIVDLKNKPTILVNKVAIFVGAHLRWEEKLIKAVEEFCEKYNAVVLCDHTSNYTGKYRVQYNLVKAQLRHQFSSNNIELLIDMGEVSGAYMELKPKEVWRVNRDGEIKDLWHSLTYIFDMDEYDFFNAYNKDIDNCIKTDYYTECKGNYDLLINKMPDLPFSNIWMAFMSCKRMPTNSIIHFGILNSLRSWNFFEIDNSITCYCNTGGFGIDGVTSAFIGSSLASPEKLHFLIIGDLAFFYDINSLANRHVGNNLRILLINNGCGTEFKNYSHFASQFGEEADLFIAAKGHYGQKSPDLIKHYSLDLGFEYICASNKNEFLENINYFCSDIKEKSILFEVFTSDEDESNALKMINHIIDDGPTIRGVAKDIVKDVLGVKGVNKLKQIIKG